MQEKSPFSNHKKIFQKEGSKEQFCLVIMYANFYGLEQATKPKPLYS